MDVTEACKHSESYCDWGKIITSVKENLPTIDLDNFSASSDNGDTSEEIIVRNLPPLKKPKPPFAPILKSNADGDGGDFQELPIYGETSKNSSNLVLDALEAGNDPLDVPKSQSSLDSLPSVLLKGLEKFSLDDVSDTLILHEKQLMHKSLGPANSLVSTVDKNVTSCTIMEELVEISKSERKNFKETGKKKRTFSRGATADLPLQNFRPCNIASYTSAAHREPATHHIDLRQTQNEESEKIDKDGNTVKQDSPGDVTLSHVKASSHQPLLSSRRNHVSGDKSLLSPCKNVAEATHAKELSKSASKALILQKIKTAKAKQIQDPQRQNSKIHITDHGTAVLSSVTDSEKTNLDRVHASQSLKNSIPDENQQRKKEEAFFNSPSSLITTLRESEENSKKSEKNEANQKLKQKSKKNSNKDSRISEATKSNKSESLQQEESNLNMIQNVQLKQKMHRHLDKQFHNRFSVKQASIFPLLYDSDLSFESEPRLLPGSVDLQAKDADVLLLSFKMLPVGCILSHRTQGKYRFAPADPTNALSMTYALLISWILALIPSNPNEPHTFTGDAFTIDQDVEQDQRTLGDTLEVPFNVVSFHQTWQEDLQLVVFNALIVPNNYYNPYASNRRRKPKKENAFYEVVKHFLQSNCIQDVCPWHMRPESALYYDEHEMQMTCTRKPMSSYITVNNSAQMIQQALRIKADFMWKITTHKNEQESEFFTNNTVQTTTCLLQREALSYPTSTFDLFIRFHFSCIDVASMRLLYLSRQQIKKIMLSCEDDSDVNEVLPCVVIALRGKSAIRKMNSIIGPRDPILARMTDQGSLNALYGEQISKRRGDAAVPTELNVFYSPRSEERANHQLVDWFSGRFSLNDEKDVDVGVEQDHSPNEWQTHVNRTRHPFLVAGSVSQMCLLVSPRFPSRFLGELLAVIYDLGFAVEGFKQIILNEKVASSLISSQFSKYFASSLLSDSTYIEDYCDVHDWWSRPTTVIVLARENAITHRFGLLAAIQTEILYRSDENQHLLELTNQCFQVLAFSNFLSTLLGPLCQFPNSNLHSLKCRQQLVADQELEQIVVLSVVGRNLLVETAKILQKILHVTCDNTRFVSSCYDQDLCEDQYQGFELLGMKYVPSLPLFKVKEIIPNEVGTQQWHATLQHCNGKQAFVCVLRRVNAYKILKLLLFNASNKLNEPARWEDSILRFISSTPQVTYRQILAFFGVNELFSDNQCRFLLKYLPPSARNYTFPSYKNQSQEESSDKVLRPRNSNKKKKQNIVECEKARINQCSDAVSETFLTSLLAPSFLLTSLLLIKPDAFPRHFVKILKRLHREDFKVVGAKLMVITEDQALEIVPAKYSKMPGEKRVFVSHVTSGASMVICVQRSNGVRKLLELAGPLNPRHGGTSTGRFSLREEFGIDEFSNAIHVSESYSRACEEVKLFFPEGLCCCSTVELNRERITAPGIDPIMCTGLSGMEVQPVCVVCSRNMISGESMPCYVDFIEQLTTQGFELCALRMVWLQTEQAAMICKLMKGKHFKVGEVSHFSDGPALLLLFQRESGLLLFDSIAERFLRLHPSINLTVDFLRSQTLAQTREAAKYCFNRIEVRHSCLKLVHKRVR